MISTVLGDVRVVRCGTCQYEVRALDGMLIGVAWKRGHIWQSYAMCETHGAYYYHGTRRDAVRAMVARLAM